MTGGRSCAGVLSTFMCLLTRLARPRLTSPGFYPRAKPAAAGITDLGQVHRRDFAEADQRQQQDEATDSTGQQKLAPDDRETGAAI